MAKHEQCILTNMCMIYDDSGRILVQDRKNVNWPGITFPGGHVEEKESFVASTIREVKEETGLSVFNLRLCGIKQFTQKDKEVRYIVFFYKTNQFEGTLASSHEGDVFWIHRSELAQYKLADGFESMLEVFENDHLNENYHYYDEGWKHKNL